MEKDYLFLTKEMRLSPGVSKGQLEKLSSLVKYPLPDDFLSFFMFSNGAVGKIGINYLRIVKAEELIPFNEQIFALMDTPRLFLFGSDGGGEAYGIDFRGKNPIIVQIPFIGMEWDAAIIKGNSFYEFLNNLFYETE